MLPAPAVPLLLQGLPGAPELIVILLVVVLLGLPLLVLAVAGVGGYLLFFRDDDDEAGADEPAGDAGVERTREDS